MITAMRETEFTLRVWGTLTPIRRPKMFRVIIDGLTYTLPEPDRARCQQDVWGWQPRGSLAPDLLVGDAKDNALAAFEFKSRRAAANASRRATYRKAPKGDDPVARRIAARWLDGTDEALDADHHESHCIGEGNECEWRGRVRGKPGWHFPAVSQADVYRSTVGYFHPQMKVGDLGDLVYVFVSPHEKSAAEFFYETEAARGDDWRVVELADVLTWWSDHLGDVDEADRGELAELINAGRQYLTDPSLVPAVS